MRLFAATTEPWQQLGNFAASLMNLDTVGDDSIEAIREKERMYEEAIRSGDYLDGRFWADTWCAAFVWKKTREFNYPITEEVFRRIERNPHACEPWMQRRDRAAWPASTASSTGTWRFRTCSGCPALEGSRKTTRRDGTVGSTWFLGIRRGKCRRRMIACFFPCIDPRSPPSPPRRSAEN